jgi:hypothetical protein
LNLSPAFRTHYFIFTENQLLEIDFAFIAMVFVNRHLNRSLLIPIVIIEDAPLWKKMQDVPIMAFPKKLRRNHLLFSVIEGIMDALKLVLAFSPWLAFWIISGHSMLRLQIGICVAAVLVIVMGITKLHRGLILWAGVIFFAFAFFAVVIFQNTWVIRHLGILASGTLFTFTFLSMTLAQPFTDSYARDHTPEELWDSAEFIRGNFTVTGVWGFIFLGNTLLNVVKLFYPELGEWAYRGVEIGFMGGGVAFTTIYSNLARKRRQSAPPEKDL